MDICDDLLFMRVLEGLGHRCIVSSPYVQIAVHPSTESRDVALLDCPPM